MMKRYVFLGVALLLGLPVLADDTRTADSGATKASISSVPEVSQGASQQIPQAVKPETQPVVVEETPEDQAYKAEMIKISDAIIKKIAQIQAKQKEIDSEVYLAYKPPLIAEKTMLESQLQDLEMARTKLQAEKVARDMAKQLKKATPNTPPQ